MKKLAGNLVVVWLALSLMALASCGGGEENHPPAATASRGDGSKAAADGKSNAKKSNTPQSSIEVGSYKDTQGPYAAIAIVNANNTVIGYVGYDEPDEATARKLAVDGCREKVAGDAGTGCKVQLVFRNACGAFATAPRGGYGIGWGKSPRRACDWALKSCRDSNNSGCTADGFVCSPGGKQGFCDGGLTIQDGTTTIRGN